MKPSPRVGSYLLLGLRILLMCRLRLGLCLTSWPAIAARTTTLIGLRGAMSQSLGQARRRLIYRPCCTRPVQTCDFSYAALGFALGLYRNPAKAPDGKKSVTL